MILSLSFQACEPGLSCGVLAVETRRSVIRVSGQSGWNLGNTGALGLQHVKLKGGVPDNSKLFNGTMSGVLSHGALA